MTAGTVLVARLDADGDVLLAGPAVRAVASSGRRVVLLVGPRGRQAAHLLPGADAIEVWAAPWIEPTRRPVEADECTRLTQLVQEHEVSEAVVLTSFHQSALPLALLLRLAGVGRITAISEDYPGSLLDVRVPDPGDVPEPVRGLVVARTAGFELAPGDEGLLRVVGPLPDVAHRLGTEPYVVLHPGTSSPARAWPRQGWHRLTALLGARGCRAVVTGSGDEQHLGRALAMTGATDITGRTTFAELAAVLAGARAVVVGNTGPAHLAAAVGTPVVSLFAPTVPAARWAPYGVPALVLGDQHAACRGTRAVECTVPAHPCLSSVSPYDVLEALDSLTGVAA